MSDKPAEKQKRTRGFFEKSEQEEIVKKAAEFMANPDSIFDHITLRTFVHIAMLEKAAFKLPKGPSAGTQLATLIGKERELLTQALDIRDRMKSEERERGPIEHQKETGRPVETDGDSDGLEESGHPEEGKRPGDDSESYRALLEEASELLAGEVPIQRAADVEDAG
jgi:hypothetical protein